MKHAFLVFLFSFLINPLAAEPLPAPGSGESIVLIGNGLGERMVDHGHFETELQLRYPGQHLVIRNLCKPGDTPGFRPHPSRKSQWAFPGAEKFRPEYAIHKGQGHFPTPDEWLTDLKADTIFAFFGYNESFDGEAGLDAFRGELKAFIEHTKSRKYNGKSAPRLVLISPIAFEDLSATGDWPDGQSENANLALYRDAMAEVASAAGVPFVDLFGPTREILQGGTSLTRNGFLPHDAGYAKLAPILADRIYGRQTANSTHRDRVLAAVLEKNWFWFNDYRMLNGVHVHGRRYKPYGNVNYPEEIEKIREMTGLRDHAIWRALEGKTSDLAKADAEKTRSLTPVPTNFKPSAKNGNPEYLVNEEEAVSKLAVPDGYKIEMFASEQQFPNLANPVQMAFDDRGRLWVATMPSYPHYRPGDTKPDDKILIYEDTDNDGRADREIVFADKLHVPTGFEISHDGVYVAQEPHLMLLKDNDGDDQADSREIVLTGFDSHDTHHAISAFCADPSGAFSMCEGVFLHTNVETPRGPVRGVDGGFYRYSPQRHRLERSSQLAIPNPWGFAYDRWGQDFFLHTSGTKINWHMPSTLQVPYGSKNPLTADLAPKGNQVRPTSGLEFMSSRHFPDEVQGDLMLGNAIGFLGIKQHRIEEDGTGYKTTFRQNLVQGSDGNFRPVDLEIAPDGSLYFLDWHNVLIGHMQHNARDPHRDHVHGRIYRITYPGRDLVKPANVAGASVAELLENLKLPEYRSRYRTRRELRRRDPAEVVPALKKWVAGLDPSDPDHGHHRLEALWVTWGFNEPDEELLRELLGHKDHRIRAAAVRVLRYHGHQIADSAALFMGAASDSHGRVRLEAAAAASWLDDNQTARQILSIVTQQPLDPWMKAPVETALNRLSGKAEVEIVEHPAPEVPAHLAATEGKKFLAGHEIYHRDGHCGTCHQPDGNGLPAAQFPPIAGSVWASGDAERLIKLTLHGLHGPIEVKGQKYPGVVPMTPFGGMLKDEEIASVLTYVRNHFGNKASTVSADQVKSVREATKDQQGFYVPEELLKEHPLE